MSVTPLVFVSGNTLNMDASGNAAQIVFTLVNTGGSVPQITGTMQAAQVVFTATANGSGVWSANIWALAQFNVTGYLWQVECFPLVNGLYSSYATWSATYTLQAGTYDLSTQVPVTTGAPSPVYNPATSLTGINLVTTTPNPISNGVGTISVLGSGNTSVAATAAGNVSTATSGNIVTSDGQGNVQDSGVPVGSIGAVSSVFGRTGTVVAVSGDYTVSQVTGAAPLASPSFTGTPTAPTAANGTNTTQVATTAFVIANGGSGGFVNPMTTTGDVITAASGGIATRLGIGSSGQVLTVSGGIPSWQNVTATSFVPSGPNPYYDIQSWGGVPRAVNAAFTTVTGSGTSLTLNAAQDFTQGNGIVVNFGGAAPAASMQTAPSWSGITTPVSSPVVQGSTTIGYCIIAVDSKCALSPCSTTVYVTNAPNNFGALPFVISSAIQSGTTLTIVTTGNMNVQTNQQVMISYFTTPSGATLFNGMLQVTGTPTNVPGTSSTFTVTLPGSASVTGTCNGSQTARIVCDNFLVTGATRSGSTGAISATVTAPSSNVIVPNAGLSTVGILSGIATAEFNPTYMLGHYPVTAFAAGVATLSTSYVAAETAVNLGQQSILTVPSYIKLNLPATSVNACTAYYIYRDITNTGNFVLAGKSMPNQQTFYDFGPRVMGNPVFKAPSYVPTTLTATGSPAEVTTTFTNQLYSGVISSITGTSAVVSPALSNAVSGQNMLHDDGKNLLNAIAAANTNAGGAVLLSPGSSSTLDTYHINSPITIPGAITVIQGARVIANETITCQNGCQWVASAGPQFGTSPQFGIINYASMAGIASPMVLAGSSCYFEGITFNDNSSSGSNGQVLMFSLAYYHHINLCQFQTFNPGTIALEYCGFGGATCSITDTQFTATGITPDTYLQGEPPYHPTLNPAILVRGDDRATGAIIYGWYWGGQNTVAGKGITFDMTNNDGPVGDYDINIWENQGPVMPMVSAWGSVSNLRLSHTIMDSSTIPLMANFGVGSTNITFTNIILASTQFALNTGYPITGLYIHGGQSPVLNVNSLAELCTSAHVSNTANNNGQPLTVRGFPEWLQGQGEIFTTAVAPITIGTVTAFTTGGSLAAGTYEIVVSAQGINGGEFAYSVPKFVTIASGTTGSIVIASWSAVTGATGYFVSGNISGSALNKQANLLAVSTAATGFTWTLNTNFNRFGDPQFPGDGPTFISNITQAIGSPNFYVVDSHFHTLVTSVVTANRTAVLPDASGNIVIDAATQTLTNKTLSVASNTITAATNTAGHYLRNNGTSYVDSTIQAGDLPNPSASTLGGVESATPVTNSFMTGISTLGVPTVAQPAFSNLSGTAATGQLPARTGAISYVIDGGGTVPTTGLKGQLNIPTAMTVTGWVLTADQSGSAVVDVLTSTFAGFPTTASIAGTDKPTLSSAQSAENLSISAWTTVLLAAGTQLQFNLSSVTSCTRLNLTLIVSIPYA